MIITIFGGDLAAEAGTGSEAVMGCGMKLSSRTTRRAQAQQKIGFMCLIVPHAERIRGTGFAIGRVRRTGCGTRRRREYQSQQWPPFLIERASPTRVGEARFF
jgi:hypothetical protein